MKNFPSYLLSVLFTFPQETIRQDQGPSMFDYISIYLAVCFRIVFFSLEDLDPMKHEHDEMHRQYS